MFYIQDIKPSNIVKLKSKKIEYIVTEHLELFDKSTGKIFAKLGNVFDLIEKVFDSNNKILAVKHDNKLLKYNAFRDDKDLSYLKTVNNLLTYDEMINELRNQDVYFGRLNVTYKQVKNEQLKLFYKTKSFKTYFGSYQSLLVMTYKDKFNQKFKTGEKRNVSINIYRYIIDETKGLELYRYSITPCLL